MQFLSFSDDGILRPLKEQEETDGYSRKFMSLRARQGMLPALKVKNDHRSSRRAVSLYKQHVGN